jgi:DNA-binding NtrC family response regulator
VCPPNCLEAAVSTVLIADDDADHRELLGLALRRAGHEVVTAVALAGRHALRPASVPVAEVRRTA